MLASGGQFRLMPSWRGEDASLGIDARSKVEARLRQLEGGSVRASAPNGAPKS